MTAVLVFVLIAAIGYLVDRALCTPAARGVPAARRIAEARRIAAEDAVGRPPCEDPLHRLGGDPRRNRPRSYVAQCHGGTAVRLRHTGRP